MRMVYSKAQVAEALGMTEEDFDRKRPDFERLGFPRPVIGLADTWSIIHVSLWVNRDDAGDEAQSDGLNEDGASARHLQ
jgi:hypothetical protein